MNWVVFGSTCAWHDEVFVYSGHDWLALQARVTRHCRLGMLGTLLPFTEVI